MHVTDGKQISHLLTAAATAARLPGNGLADALDRLPAAIYVTDAQGVITYHNPACEALAGRTPERGRDKWCVTHKIYTLDGEFLPHDQCPMAVAIREQRPVREVEAIAERPDGSRIQFQPFPTPLFDEAGAFVGAVNILVDVTDERKPEHLRDQAARCRRLSRSINDERAVATLEQMAVRYDEQAARASRWH
jgi:PAS domain S-box-containing protein